MVIHTIHPVNYHYHRIPVRNYHLLQQLPLQQHHPHGTIHMIAAVVIIIIAETIVINIQHIIQTFIIVMEALRTDEDHSHHKIHHRLNTMEAINLVQAGDLIVLPIHLIIKKIVPQSLYLMKVKYYNP